MVSPSFRPALTRLKALLRAGDVRGALIYLNSLTEHRFSALYRFDKETLRNVYFFDRENPSQETVADLPVLASYCVFVRGSQKTFATSHAECDPRVGDHPKRLEIQSYCGVPLRDIDGEMFGTLCHFDPRPIAVTEESIDLIEAIAPFIRRAPGGAPHVIAAAEHDTE